MHSRRLLKQACGPQTDQTRVRTRRALNIEMLFCIKSRIEESDSFESFMQLSRIFTPAHVAVRLRSPHDRFVLN